MKCKKPKKAEKKTGIDNFLFDDCPICRAMKKADKQGKVLDGKELLDAFAEANKNSKELKF